MGSLLPFGLGALVLAGFCWFCTRHHAPMIQDDIRTRTAAFLKESGLQLPPNAVSVDGRDVTLNGPKGWSITSEETRKKIEDLWGVRVAKVRYTSDEPAPPPAIPPAEVTKVELDLQQYLTGKNIRFKTAKDVIQPDGRVILDQVALILKRAPKIPIEISGHTDNSGDAQRNLTLSLRRAEAVKRYLIAKGIAADRLTTQGFGPDRPIANNGTAAGMALNRRIEFHATGR